MQLGWLLISAAPKAAAPLKPSGVAVMLHHAPVSPQLLWTWPSCSKVVEAAPLERLGGEVITLAPNEKQVIAEAK